ncbi:MAG: nuclear transport factor 2 family protein [Novosphingobium sp.]
MTEDERRAIEADCARLIAIYANANDEARWEDVAALYVEDGVMFRPTAPDAPLHGRAAILAAFQGRPPRKTRHVCSNVVITVDGPGSASGVSAMVLLQPDAAPLAGSFRDRFVRTPEGWRFAERRGSLAW